ncbi:MAG: SGNH/GDSL hydrolase family protein [Clostridiales bacterium]|nr:SGNH/GDSL hydrolase family protein [Clostridiales bacterium]
MKLYDYLLKPTENPLDNIPEDGGFSAIFRTIACIGDSLSSGEFESRNPDGSRGYHDMFEYSWGQFIARQIGAKVYNFSRGGMTAIEYVKSFAEANDMWSKEKLAQAYIVALGCNDLLGMNQTVGTVDDLRDDYTENPDTFAGWYGKVIQRYMKMQPRAKFFLMTMVRGGDADYDAKVAAQAQLMRDIAARFDNTYVIDLERYGPVYDEAFREKFFMLGHMNPAGYLLTAKMTMAYIDYIIRSDFKAFRDVGFIGTDLYD